jgi:hypothetical protein
MTRRTLVILYLLAAVALASLFREEPALLLVGWLAFLGRNLRQVTVNPAGVATGIAATVLLLGLTHYLGRWWCRAASGGADAPPRRWRFRWSLAAMILLWVAFAAGFSAIGLARHIGWLLSSGEPAYVERVDRRLSDDF